MRRILLLIFLVGLVFIIGCNSQKTLDECDQLEQNKVASCIDEVMEDIQTINECSKFSSPTLCEGLLAARPTSLEFCNQFEGTNNHLCVNKWAKKISSEDPELQVNICMSHKDASGRDDCIVKVATDMINNYPEKKNEAYEICGKIEGSHFKGQCYGTIARIVEEVDLNICENIEEWPTKNNCIRTVAKNAENPSLCESIDHEDMKNDCIIIAGGAVETIEKSLDEGCVDSDGGYYPEIKGTTNKGDESKTDSCLTDLIVQEYVCQDNEIFLQNQGCDGKKCVDGACI